MSKNTFHLVSLGCAKNTVDSDSMAQLLLRDGYHAVDDPARANVLIVNTCGFIGPAKQESINVLRELAEGKRSNQLLIAAGCLTQRYGSEVAEKVPGTTRPLKTSSPSTTTRINVRSTATRFTCTLTFRFCVGMTMVTVASAKDSTGDKVAVGVIKVGSGDASKTSEMEGAVG